MTKADQRSRHPRALDGIRVIEFGHCIAGPLVGMMLADHGAHVTRVLPPGGPRRRHPADAMLARGKHEAVIDLAAPAGREAARRLVLDADVVVENFRPGVLARHGLDAARLESEAPRLVFCSLPGFPSDDRRAGLPGWEPVVAAAAGLFTPPSGAAGLPVPPRMPIASLFAALIAFNCVLAALIERERSGRGQRVEVSLFEAAFEVYGDQALELPPDVVAPTMFHAASEGNYRCADGRWVHLSLIADRHLRWFVERCMPPELVEPGMADRGRLIEDGALAQRLRERIAGLLASRPALEWEELANAAGVPCAVHRDLREWVEGDQARASRAVIIPPGADGPQIGFAVDLSETPAAVRAADGAPADASRPWTRRRLPEGGGPLAGISVLDFTQILSGPTAGRILAELGADVVKINQPDGWVIAHTQVNSGKDSVLVDLRKAEARPVLDAMIAVGDVVMHNFTPGVAERLGIGEADVRARRADIVHASFSAYGVPGPMAGRRGWETLAETVTGMMLAGGAGGEPVPERFLVCDYGGGHLLAGGVLLALLHRQRHGRGQAVHTSLAHAAIYARLADVAGLAGGAADDSLPELDVVSRDGRWHAVATADGSVSEHPVLTIADNLRDEDVRRRGLSVVREHPGLGAVRFTGPARRLSRTPAVLARPAGMPGSATRAVLERLGLGEDVDRLVALGVVAEQLAPEAVLDP